MNKYNVLSLFASAGIAEFGFDEDKYNVVLANELLPIRATLHEFWHPNTEMICGDIIKDEIKNEIIKKAKKNKVDFIFATPPCQGVSLIGKNKTNDQMLLDERNFLIFHTFDIIDKLNPKIILIENVARFFKMKYPMDSGFETIEKIINDKYGDKYNISCSVYNAADYGVPQNRERAIIKMWKKRSIKWDEPTKTPHITVREAISHLPSLEAGEKSNIKNHNARNHTPANILCMKHTPSGKSATENEIYYPKNEKTGERVSCYSASYKRIDWDKPAPTITMRNDCISSQSNVHPGRLLEDGTYSDARVLTLRELFILSSMNPDLDIPSNVSDIQVRHAIGEAVPPKLISAVLSGLKGGKFDD